MVLRNKIVFIISYEEWGDMLMSKHHYAIELSKRGNQVYFINRPDLQRKFKRGEIRISATHYENLHSVNIRLVHPFIWKYKFRALNRILISWQIKRMVRKIGARPDIIWSFDGNNIFPLKYFATSALKIFMPVDGPYWVKEESLSAETADIIISVTDRILHRYADIPIPKYQVNHGVSNIFINKDISLKKNYPFHIGYAGSLVRSDLDVEAFYNIIKSHPDKIFEFWGEDNPAKSTIHLPQDIDRETKYFLQFLKSSPNVIMHGAVKSNILAAGLKRMDAFLIAYNIKNDQNHHKVLEYLGAGKVIISSYMSSYVDYPELIEMIKTENGRSLPDLFNDVLENIESFNSIAKQQSRVSFAQQNTYSAQLAKVEIMLKRINK